MNTGTEEEGVGTDSKQGREMNKQRIECKDLKRCRQISDSWWN